LFNDMKVIGIKELKTGMYIVKIKLSDGNIISRKFIKLLK